ncbi:keratin, type II cytoskeletal 2 epidermal [Trifolium repens]|nr:keratin, type II cytoskeletal 2 epidermal [Trifolium repens]
MKKIVTDAFGVYQMANDNRKKATWLHPKTRRQPNSDDCGYYVMKNMLDIVSANITDSWVEIFNDPQMLTKHEMYDL